MKFLRYGAPVFLGLAFVAAGGSNLPIPALNPAPAAQAQDVNISVEFRSALEPHGQWRRHSRWGEVWTPANVDAEWQPYTRGRWVYTEEWGWYWIAEEEWGWVPYHYGRWARDAEFGWVWVPGNEWAPAWVSWRRGGDGNIGWAALPPDEVVEEYEDDPEYWTFVRAQDIAAASIVAVLLPRRDRVVYVRDTVVVSRTVYVTRGGRGRIGANVGIPPSYVARFTGRPFRASTVRPVVVRGTVGITNAVIGDPRNRRGDRPFRAEVKQSNRNIQAAKEVPPPQRLGFGERQRANPDGPAVIRQAQPNDTTPVGKKGPGDTKQQKSDQPKSDQPKSDQPKSDQPKGFTKDGPKDGPKGEKKDRPKDKDAPKDRPQDQPKADKKGEPKDQPKGEKKAKQPPAKDGPKSDGPKNDGPKSDGPPAKQPPAKAAPKADTPKGPPPKADTPKGPPAKAEPRGEQPKAEPKGPPPQQQKAPPPPPQKAPPPPPQKAPPAGDQKKQDN